MKKQEGILLTGAMAIVLASGIMAAAAEEDILKCMEQANTISRILENHQNVTVNIIKKEKNGQGTWSEYIYRDKDIRVIEDSNSNIEVRKKDELYGFSADDNAGYWEGFMEPDTNWDVSFQQTMGFQYTPGEKILSVSEEDEVLLVETQMEWKDIADDEREAAAWYGQMEEDDKIHAKYWIDPETYELQREQNYQVKSDGTEIESNEMIYRYDVEPYQSSEELLTLIEGGSEEESRKITLIADSGTEKERGYEKKLAKGLLGCWHLAEGYNKVYLDKECTKIPEEINTNEDTLQYVAEGK